MPEEKRLAVYDLTGRTTKTIGVIADTFASPILIPALMGIREVAARCGYEIVISPAPQNAQEHPGDMPLWPDNRVDGTLAFLSSDIFYNCAVPGHRQGRIVMDNTRSGDD